MAQRKISVNRESSETQSAKSKRRRKCQQRPLKSYLQSTVDTNSTAIDDLKMLEATKFNKLQKHRWKLNANDSSCLTANIDNTTHQCCPTKKSTKFHPKMCSCCTSSANRKLKLTDMMTTSSVKKLLPIFILVNMLPFLYAGESKKNE